MIALLSIPISGLLVKEETHQYGRVYTTKYKYDSNRRITEIAGWDETLKYKYDNDGKLIRKDEIDDSTTVTYYHYDEGLLVREEVDFGNNGIINFVQYFFYDKNRNLIRRQYNSIDGKTQYWTKYFYETINVH